MVRVPEMGRVPEKRDDMYQYFQYIIKYVLEKAVHVPNDLIAYHYYSLLRTIIIISCTEKSVNSWFEITVFGTRFGTQPQILVHIGTCTNLIKGSSI